MASAEPARTNRRRFRFGAWWRQYRWLVLLGAACLAIALAWYGAEGGRLEKLDTVLRLLPIGLGIDAQESRSLQFARILATFVFAYATFKAFAVLFGERLQEIRAGRKRGHTIVCGLGRRGTALTESLLGSGKVVAVELDPLNPAIDRLRDEGAVVLVGDATDADVLERAGVAHAQQVVAVCPQDGVNAQIAARVLELSQETATPPVDTYVHVSDPHLCKFLIQHTFMADDEWLEFFNVYDRGAEALLRETEALREDRPVLVLGAGQFGLAVVSQLARERYERLAEDPGAGKLRVYIVDREATSRAAELHERYSQFQEACDLRTLEVDVGSPAFDRLFQEHTELAEIRVAFVCFDSDPLAITTALNLLDQTEDTIIVTARVFDRKTGIAGLLERTRGAKAANFRPVSIAEGACRADLILEGIRGRLARHVHEVYRRDNRGKEYDVPWEELTDEGIRRNLAHAEGIARQLEKAGYRLGPLVDWGASVAELTPEAIELMAEREHERWMEERIEDGWQYGPVRDNEQKLHPDLLPWSELSEKVKDIDRNLVRERPAMLARVGVEIYPARASDARPDAALAGTPQRRGSDGDVPGSEPVRLEDDDVRV